MTAGNFRALAVVGAVFSKTLMAFGETQFQNAPWTGGSGGSATEGETFSHWSPSLGGLSGQTGVKTKEGWGMIDGYFTPYEHMTGGGASFSLEWIDDDWRVGLGGRVGVSFMKGDDGDFDIESDILDLDIHIPVRLADWLIAYGGIGLEAFNMEYSYVIPGTFRYQSNGQYYTKNGKKITYTSETPSSLTTLYAGLRFLITDNFYLYGEYHQDSGSISMNGSGSYVSGVARDMKVDMDNSRYVLGAGFCF